MFSIQSDNLLSFWFNLSPVIRVKRYVVCLFVFCLFFGGFGFFQIKIRKRKGEIFATPHAGYSQPLLILCRKTDVDGTSEYITIYLLDI